MEHRPILPASAPLSALDRFLPSDLGSTPLLAVAAALRGFNRDQLGSTIEVLIALMDVADGDPDAEAGNDLEDDFVLSANAVEMGRNPAVDCVDQDAGAYVEWHTMRGSQKRGPNLLAGHEDDEDDDPDTSVEDDPLGIDPEEDLGADDVGEQDEAEEGLTPDWGIDQTTPMPEALVIASDRQAIKPHRERIRRTRCIPTYLRNFRSGRLEPSPNDFRLIEEPIAPTRQQLLRRKRGVPRRPRA